MLHKSNSTLSNLILSVCPLSPSLAARTPPAFKSKKHLSVTICCPAKIHFITITILTARVEAKWGGNNRIVSPPHTLPLPLSLCLSLSFCHRQPTRTPGDDDPFRGRGRNPERVTDVELHSPPRNISDVFSIATFSFPASPAVAPTLWRARKEEARWTPSRWDPDGGRGGFLLHGGFKVSLILLLLSHEIHLSCVRAGRDTQTNFRFRFYSEKYKRFLTINSKNQVEQHQKDVK